MKSGRLLPVWRGEGCRVYFFQFYFFEAIAAVCSGSPATSDDADVKIWLATAAKTMAAMSEP